MADVQTIEWDLNYDLATFNPTVSGAPTTPGILDPTQFYPSTGITGDFFAALRVTTNDGAVFMAGTTVHVNNVAPTATFTTPASIMEGTTATFNVGNVQDPDPADAFTYWADWDGDGNFVYLNPVMTGDGGFTHRFDDSGVYHPVFRVMNAHGDYTDYTQDVAVTNVAPHAEYFGPTERFMGIGAGAPLRFANVFDVSHADMQAGLTYYYSVNGGAFAASSAPECFLPSYAPNTTYTVRAYVTDKDGGQSPLYQSQVMVGATATYVVNHGDATVDLTWTGGSAELGSGQYYIIPTTVSNLQAAVVTPGRSAVLQTNGTFTAVTAADGVALSLSNRVVSLSGTSAAPGSAAGGAALFYGHGDLPSVTLGIGGSLAVDVRGTLGTVTAGDVDYGSFACQGLTGSITGFEQIGGANANTFLAPDGVLGTAGGVVTAAHGIGAVTGYGIAAYVTTDTAYDAANTLALTVTAQDGGVTGTIDGGTVQGLTVRGDVNQFLAKMLTGVFMTTAPGAINLIYLQGTTALAAIQAPQAESESVIYAPLLGQQDLVLDEVRVKYLGRLTFVGKDITTP